MVNGILDVTFGGQAMNAGLNIDKAGRIVVPKSLRDRLGFAPGTVLQAIEHPAGLLLKKVEQSPSMVNIDGLWIHQGAPEREANWERMMESVREERIESVPKRKPVNIFFDTTVLIAASERSHPYHTRAKPAHWYTGKQKPL